MTEQQVVIDHIKRITKELEKLPKEKRKHAALTEVRKHFSAYLPESLCEISSGLFFDGDSGVNMEEKPSWLDMDKFRRGQKFYQDYSFANTYNEVLALFALFSFEVGLEPFIFTGASSTPYTAFKRYLSTHFRLENWYTSDPWTRGTPAYNDMRYTRKIHNTIRKTLSNASEEVYTEKIKLNPMWSTSTEETRQDFKSACPFTAPSSNTMQCPYVVLSNFSNQSIHHANQALMSTAQFGFCGIIVSKPELFGIHNATDEELDAFCHVWRGFGYLLGIDDDYNFCRGTLEDVRARSKDLLEYWVKPNFREISSKWEHILRCLSESTRYYYPLTNFECVLLHLAELMEVPMPRFFALLPYRVKLLRYISRLYFHYVSKIPGVQKLMNFTLKRAMLRAKKFDKKTHKRLQIESEKTLEYSLRKQKSTDKSEMLNEIRSFAIKLIAITVTVMCTIMYLY